jgi:hydrogenase maturation protein HypF
MSTTATRLQTITPKALHLQLSGQVQGVGFRPFVHQLAQALGLAGWVRNRIGQVEIHIQGEHAALQNFMRRLFENAPPLARPQLDNCTAATAADLQDFSIRASAANGPRCIHIPTDLYTCDDCLGELEDPNDRRYHYPFINCTQCGPRYTLIRSMPYDRPATTMANFTLCAKCEAEYRLPSNRRFHAEPVACPECGPQLEFHCGDEPPVHGNDAALAATVAALRAGQTVAIKGIGGYHLMCDADNDRAIQQLRASKPRPDKPLAVMFPAPVGRPLRCIKDIVWLSRDEADLLRSPQRPIVLARKKPRGRISRLVAPGLGEIGVMLPYSPLHHLLLNSFGGPLVATSANISGEPVLTENSQVEERLAHVTDSFLHHNRPIARPADDPVYRIIQDHPRLLRGGRGCAPLEHKLRFSLDQPLLAVGGHMKNTVALAWDNRIVISPHIGDMGNARSLSVFEQTVHDLQALYQVDASIVVCDAHPGYTTSRWAYSCGLPVERVLHHHAHAAVACPEAGPETPALVFTWDGVGYGADGTLWGGEALLGHPGHWQRFASLRPFFLPGGERAGREPWRSAAALCWETGTSCNCLPDNAMLAQQAWQQRINTPQSSAAGRLFDAAAALAGLCNFASFEGQGPMLLEAACEKMSDSVELTLRQNEDGLWISDWAPLLPMLQDKSRSVAERAGMFHASLAAAIAQQARCAREQHGVQHVGLSGGVFQNRVLTEQVFALLQQEGFEVTLPEDIPVNDAGLCYGQVIEYGARTRNG